MRVSIDTGGTFTDVILTLADGRRWVHKLPSTPHDPGEAVVEGIREVLARVRTEDGASGAAETSADADEVLLDVLHGTTVGTNALLERDGARTLLVATRGFTDLLALGRQARPELYRLDVRVPPPLVADSDTFPLDERLAPDGTPERVPDAAALDALAAAVAERVSSHRAGIEPDSEDGSAGDVAVAVCLLHAYANPDHEVRVVEALRAALPDDVYVCRSSQVLPEIREYERASTTSANAFIAPRVARYLRRLDDRVSDFDDPPPALRIMQSNAGLMSAAEAAGRPIQTALSGPAGGVLGALESARQLGIDRIVTFDMGGTSTDVGFCADGEAQLGADGHVGDIAVRIPMVDLHTVGAGGGSIASLDSGGALKVGPRSAGARPGPACYGHGGTEPTVSDAHAVLGRLRPEAFLAGDLALDLDAARAAVTQLADAAGLGIDEAAAGILSVADAHMARAIRVMSVARGHVPERLTLVAFGGAGGLHACALASMVGIPRVVIPPEPGLLSAFGMLHAPVVRHASRSVLADLGTSSGSLPNAIGDLLDGEARRLAEEALAALERDLDGSREPDAGSDAEPRLRVMAALRYRGQSFELDVPAAETTAEPGDLTIDWSDVRHRFERAHETRYGYVMDGRAIDVVTLRASAAARLPKPGLAQPRTASSPTRTVSAVFAGERCVCACVDREALAIGTPLPGPAIVTEYTSTTVVPPDWSATRARTGALVIERAG